MGCLAMEEMPLSALFEQTRKIHLKSSLSGVDQDLVKKRCEMLQKCEEMIGKLGLFSSNETKEDISTNNLKYLLVPYYLAELMEKIIQDDQIEIVKASYEKLKEFFSFCEAMELVPDEELQASSRGGSAPPADRRALKIARFKRQKAAETKLLEIKERKERRGRSTKAAALSTPVESGEEDIPDDDSEEEREAWLSTINLAICKAIDLLEMLKKEEEMLTAIKERQLKNGEDEFSREALDDRAKKAETWHRDASVRIQYSKPAQPITCATFAQDVLEGRASVSQGHEHEHQPLIFGPASIVGGPLSTERERMIAQSEELKLRLVKLREIAERKEYAELVKDITPKKQVEEPFSSYKDQLGFGLHVGLTMFTGYLVGYASFRALFNHNPALSAAGGILGLVLAMLVETLLFIIKTSKDDLLQSSNSFTPTTKEESVELSFPSPSDSSEKRKRIVGI